MSTLAVAFDFVLRPKRQRKTPKRTSNPWNPWNPKTCYPPRVTCRLRSNHHCWVWERQSRHHHLFRRSSTGSWHCPSASKAFTASTDGNGGNEISSQLTKLLGDDKITKAVHDYKAALRELQAHGLTLAGVRDEPMLYSYLVNPTYPRIHWRK